MVIDNRGGTCCTIGAELFANAQPDGFTILVDTVGTGAINATLYKEFSRDPVKDFTPIALVAITPRAVEVNPGAGTASVSDLVAKSNAEPGQIAYGSGGADLKDIEATAKGGVYSPANLPATVAIDPAG